jgi:hypothetical protein
MQGQAKQPRGGIAMKTRRKSSLRPSEVSVRQFSVDCMQELNVTLESRTNARVDFWLEHESLKVQPDVKSYVG